MATNKKVEFGAKPKAASADDWVGAHKASDTKRLTLDIPANLHARIKSACAVSGVSMVDAITQILEEKYGA